MSEKQEKKELLLNRQLETDGARLKIARIMSGMTIPEVAEKLQDKVRPTAIQHMECGHESDLFKHSKVFKLIGGKVPIKLTIPYLEEVLDILNDRLSKLGDNHKSVDLAGKTSRLKKEIIWVNELKKEIENNK